MKIKFLAVIALIAGIAFTSCDDTTDSIGTSLTDNKDLLSVATDTFTVTSSSLVVDSVLARNTIGYLGKIRDPETSAYITGDFMAQFASFEDYTLPERDSILSLENGDIIADSVHIRLYYDEFYGDSLSAMNMTVYELSKPYEEGVNYYSNFDPFKNGMIRTDANALRKNKTYTLTDMTVSEEEREDDDYTPNIKIDLSNDEYIDADGVSYKNYGTYILKKYYEDPSYFKNSYSFIHNVCPGMYFKVNDGLGSMAYIYMSQLRVYFNYAYSDSVYVGACVFSGTEEVLQKTNVINDDNVINELASDNSCTHLKTPAGIFTELTLPVEDIKLNHENDTLNTAKIVLTRYNNKTFNDYNLPAPSTLLMIPKDSLNSFFENQEVPDYEGSFIATTSSTYNTYTFNNVADIITTMYNNRQQGLASNSNWENEHPDWNKVVVVPVTLTYSSSSSSTIVKTVHDMSLTGTRLVGGSENPYDEIKVSVIYSKFREE
ncbi:MAG: DUF4270 domain-containing protein [Prevotellaceae bacterium]|nr:DUF4270 domain-containing protein [Prevotellaceae bacterium]